MLNMDKCDKDTGTVCLFNQCMYVDVSEVPIVIV